MDKEAKFIADDAFYFGIGLFETMAVCKGKILLEDYHKKRLEKSLQLLNIKREPCIWQELEPLFEEEIRAFKKNNPKQADYFAIKISVSDKNIFAEARPIPYKKEDYERAFNLRTSSVIRNETSIFTRVKSFNYGDNILEKRKAKKDGYDEPIFVNSKGKVAEGATSNIFAVKDGEIITPSINCGILAGTVRAYLLDIADKLSIKIKEVGLSLKDFKEAKEVFVTNALLGVMPVRAWDEKKYEIGPVSKKLMEAYQQIAIF